MLSEEVENFLPLLDFLRSFFAKKLSKSAMMDVRGATTGRGIRIIEKKKKKTLTRVQMWFVYEC